MTARLPSVGGDQDNWGTVLNEFLQVSLTEEGKIKILAVDIPFDTTITPNVDTTEIATIGALTADATIANPTGTPADGQILVLRFTQDSTGSHALTWGDGYVFQTGAASYVLTAANAQWEVAFRWSAAAGKWLAISRPDGQVIATSTNIISVSDYSATGDGTTDDSAAFLAAYNATSQNNSIYVPSTSNFYKIDSTGLLWNWDKFYGPGLIQYRSCKVTADGRKGQTFAKGYNPIAHRGFSTLTPEESMSGYTNAIAMGMQSIEGDIRLTSDNIPVFIHDATLNRTISGQTGNVSSYSLSQLQAFSSGSNDYTSSRVATFDEVCKLAKKHGVKLYAEIKTSAKADVDVINQVILSNDMRDNIVMESFMYDQLAYMRTLNYDVGLVWHQQNATITTDIDRLMFAGKSTLFPDQSLLTSNNAAQVKAYGVDIGAYTITTRDQVETLLSKGVYNMLTDDFVPIDSTQFRGVRSVYATDPNWSLNDWTKVTFNGTSGVNGKIFTATKSGSNAKLVRYVPLRPGQTVMLEVEARSVGGINGCGIYIDVDTPGNTKQFLQFSNPDMQRKFISYTCPYTSPNGVTAIVGCGGTNLGTAPSASFVAEYMNPRIYVGGLATNTPLRVDASGIPSIEGEDTTDLLDLKQYSNTATNHPAPIHVRYRGTKLAPAAVQSGDVLGGIYAKGFGATTLSKSVGAVRVVAAQNFTDSASGTKMIFDVTPLGALTRVPQMTLMADGSISMGTTASPDTTAQLDVVSTTKGFLPPRMTTTQRDAISTPAEGLIVYNTSAHKHQGWNGSTWNDLY